MSLFQTAVSNALSTIESLRSVEPELLRAVDLVKTCLLSGGKLLVAGNGGSAADAADFSAEYTCRFNEDRKPFAAINLASCGSALTAIGNDYGVEFTFSRQVEAFARPGDVLVAISTSGNSPNILRALDTAAALQISSISMLGRDGGRCRGKATVEFVVSSPITARIQEAHKFLLHSICEQVDVALREASRP